MLFIEIKKRLSALIAALVITLGFPCAAFAEDLYSTQSRLYVPWLDFQGQTFSASFNTYIEEGGGIYFTLQDVGLRTDGPTYGSVPTVDQSLTLDLSRVNFQGSEYQARLTHAPDLGPLAFRLSNLALAQEPAVQRGAIQSSELVLQMTASEIDALVNSYVGSQQALIAALGMDLSARYDIDLYRINYLTIDPAGEQAIASGLVALPQGATSDLPLVSYQHGTITDRNDVPSKEIYDLPTIVLAGSGYVAAAPDFLGLGDSSGLHPFVHANSLASSIVDSLRATRSLSQSQSVSLSGQLFLIGYSEGGYATMAAHRAIEQKHGDEFSLTASAPMAGPYDLSGAMLERFLDNTPHPNPYYFPYITLALNQIYGLTDELADLFQDDYAGSIEGLFDGAHSGSEINAGIPTDMAQLFSSEMFADLQDGSSHLFASLVENDLIRWKPAGAMKLYHCSNDDQVPFANTQNAYDAFQALGATQVQMDSGALFGAFISQDAHSSCSLPLLLLGKTWFDGMVN